jgi:hypothetical protein
MTDPKVLQKGHNMLESKKNHANSINVKKPKCISEYNIEAAMNSM